MVLSVTLAAVEAQLPTCVPVFGDTQQLVRGLQQVLGAHQGLQESRSGSVFTPAAVNASIRPVARAAVRSCVAPGSAGSQRSGST